MILPSSSINVYPNSIASNKNFYTGHMDLQTLDFDPLVGGYAFIKWDKIPFWMDKLFPNEAFQRMTEKNFKEFSGVSSMELESGEYSHTFNGNAYNVATSITKNNTSFTLKHQEFSGSPIKNMYQAWVSGIRDPRTGIATYPRMYNCEYAAKNHTGCLWYIVTRPDADNVDKHNIEFAAYYTNVYPTKIPLDHFNYSQGSHDLTEIDIEFKGTMNISPLVDEGAVTVLKSAFSLVSEGMFNPDPKGVQDYPENLSSEIDRTANGSTGDGNTYPRE